MKSKLVLAALLLLVFASACAGLSSEPRIVSSLPPPTPMPTEVGHPLAPPDMARGAALYAQHCAPCHGVSGDGDGVLVREGSVVNPGIFSDPATASGQRPTDWYSTITNGRIDKLMPPWRDALSEEERWVVGFYTYTLHYDPAELERGAAIWVDQCVECHGEEGHGDGERAERLGREVADLTNLQSIVTQTDEVYYVTVTEGVGDNMPAYLDDLPEADRWAVARYARTLALANADAIGRPGAEAVAQADATAEAEAAAEIRGTVTVGGQVTNGTLTGTVPAGQEMVLFVFDASLNQTQFSVGVGEDGRYAFDDIAYAPDSVYVVTTNYRERVFASAVLRGDELIADAADGALDLPVTFYELTEDPAVIEISGMVTQVSVVGDSLQVAQVLTLRNTSDRAFSSSQTTSDGRSLSAVIALPPGSVVTDLPENNRYVVGEQDFAVIDTIPVLPGDDHLIQLVYLIPYEDAAIIEQPLTYALNGAVRLLLNPPTVSVTSAQLPALGAETLGTAQYAAYGAALTLNPGDVIRYDLSGTGLEVSPTGEVQTPSTSSLPAQFVLVLGALALLVGAAYLIYYRTKSTPQAKAQAASKSPEAGGSSGLIDALMAQIADLEAQHNAGAIADDDYQRQRAALKQRLATLLEKP